MQRIPTEKDELIGKRVTVTKCTDPTFIGVSGSVIDETKNTLLIQTEKSIKRIAKQSATFEFEDHGKKAIVEGSRLMYRPEDRIKKAR